MVVNDMTDGGDGGNGGREDHKQHRCRIDLLCERESATSVPGSRDKITFPLQMVGLVGGSVRVHLLFGSCRFLLSVLVSMSSLQGKIKRDLC